MPPMEGVTPFPPEFAARYRARGYWEDQPQGLLFAEVFARHGDRVALVAGDARITYRQLGALVDRLALHLLALGMRPYDRIVLQLPNTVEFVTLYFALQRIGAIPVMALASHRSTEINQFVALSEAVAYAIPAISGDFAYGALAARIQAEHPTLRWVFVAGVAGATDMPGAISLTTLLATESNLSADALDRLTIDPTAPALLQLSGGTTGVPKLIPRTHNDYVYNTKIAVAINDIHPDDALLVVLPIAHNFPLACPGIQGFLLQGARCVLGESVRAGDALPLIAREHVTHLELVPAALIRWINDSALAQYDLSSVRVINTGGQKLQPAVKRRTEELIPSARVQEVFGMAEGLLCFVRLDDPTEVRLHTVGRPLSPDDEIKLVDDDDNEVTPGAIGELLTRGPYTLRGYYRAPEYNQRAFTPDGFYRSGDLMRLHPSGNYIVEGRKKDLINRGGEKISAEEIENLILTHPAVVNASCVPAPDPVLGERMCAFVILRPGASLTLAELVAYLQTHDIARFKLPERLEIVADFPLSKFGKVQKQALAQRLAASPTEASPTEASPTEARTRARREASEEKPACEELTYIAIPTLPPGSAQSSPTPRPFERIGIALGSRRQKRRWWRNYAPLRYRR